MITPTTADAPGGEGGPANAVSAISPKQHARRVSWADDEVVDERVPVAAVRSAADDAEAAAVAEAAKKRRKPGKKQQRQRRVCCELVVSVCRSCVSSSSVLRPPIPRWCPVRAWLFFTFLPTYLPVIVLARASSHLCRACLLCERVVCM